jgi:PilZ domain
MLTYDETSEVRCAFEEAYIEPGRRRAIRTRQRVSVKITPWRKGITADPIDVVIEDFSPYGIGISHAVPMELGSHYILRVPRQGEDDLQVLLTVVRRCQADVANYSIGLEATAILGGDAANIPTLDKYANAVVSRKVKLLFLLFGIISVTVMVQLNVL